MITCPDCDRSFKSAQTLRMHRAYKHAGGATTTPAAKVDDDDDEPPKKRPAPRAKPATKPAISSKPATPARTTHEADDEDDAYPWE